MKNHRATGNPRGRPPTVPFDLPHHMLEFIRRRIDPKTGLSSVTWMELAREFHVSRSTIARRMQDLRESGDVESIWVKVSPKVSVCYYRVL